MSLATDEYIVLVPLSWSELARRTWREVIEDDVLGLAAQLSYYFFESGSPQENRSLSSRLH